MAIKTYNCTALTGGAARALDAISVSVLANGDRAQVLSGGKIYFFVFNSASIAAEISPGTIRPNDYATAGVWENLGSPFGDIGPTITATVPIYGDIRGGDISVAANVVTMSPCSCRDSTGQVALYTGVNKDFTLPSTNNGLFYGFLVRFVADSSVGLKFYTAITGAGSPDSDALVDCWRLRTFAKNNGAGVTIPYSQLGDRIEWTVFANRPVLTASVTNSYLSYDVSAILPISILKSFELIGIGPLYVSYDGTNPSYYVVTNALCILHPVAGIYLRDPAFGGANIAAVTLRG